MNQAPYINVGVAKKFSLPVVKQRKFCSVDDEIVTEDEELTCVVMPDGVRLMTLRRGNKCVREVHPLLDERSLLRYGLLICFQQYPHMIEESRAREAQFLAVKLLRREPAEEVWYRNFRLKHTNTGAFFNSIVIDNITYEKGKHDLDGIMRENRLEGTGDYFLYVNPVILSMKEHAEQE